MYDKRMNLTRQVASEVRQHFGGQVFETVIPRNVRLSESPSFGKPVLLYDIDSAGSRGYLQLAQELLQRRGMHPGARQARRARQRPGASARGTSGGKGEDRR